MHLTFMTSKLKRKENYSNLQKIQLKKVLYKSTVGKQKMCIHLINCLKNTPKTQTDIQYLNKLKQTLYLLPFPSQYSQTLISPWAAGTESCAECLKTRENTSILLLFFQLPNPDDQPTTSNNALTRIPNLM